MDVSARLERRVRRDFEPGSVEPVLSRLSELALEPEGAERIQAAVVLLAAGSWPRFEHAVEEATVDWRDVLMGSGLEHEGWRERLDAELGPSR